MARLVNLFGIAAALAVSPAFAFKKAEPATPIAAVTTVPEASAPAAPTTQQQQAGKGQGEIQQSTQAKPAAPVAVSAPAIKLTPTTPVVKASPAPVPQTAAVAPISPYTAADQHRHEAAMAATKAEIDRSMARIKALAPKDHVSQELRE